jgi:tRNA uracil 4-sulfurtransferase
MKRGLEIEAVHFASPPYTSAQAVRKVMDLAKQLSRFQPGLIVHTLNITALQVELYAKANPSYAVILLRRHMMRLATRLASQSDMPKPSSPGNPWVKWRRNQWKA